MSDGIYLGNMVKELTQAVRTLEHTIKHHEDVGTRLLRLVSSPVYAQYAAAQGKDDIACLGSHPSVTEVTVCMALLNIVLCAAGKELAAMHDDVNAKERQAAAKIITDWWFRSNGAKDSDLYTKVAVK